MNKNSKMGFMGPVLMCSILGFVSCGGDSGVGRIFQEQQETEGRYQVELRPVNNQYGQEISGNGEIVIEGDQVTVNMQVSGAPIGTHMQHIHSGRACPTMEADSNGDEIVDAVEAQAVSGRVLIPLNGDLNGQRDGEGQYPSGRSYSYSQSASLSRMLADLRFDDDDQNDSLVKLDTDEELNLEGRVVEIHGVSSVEKFPATVQSIDGKPTHETLPIACGVIRRLPEAAPASPAPGADGANTGTEGTGTTDPEGPDGQGGTLDRIGDDIQDAIDSL